ncbi:sulfotransferase family protein [Paenibacillus alvei]|uniref:sulfotransferase family protein n=1 Tax=Paenibacillus alvei TaxID=44250 RepID=UPI0003866130|nr:sulfotransferase [Paenibacillus alvei]EPY14014.1 hypothetical protein PAAL66ix_04954 [Paenibacillus alvei A6-6i-x]
MQKQPIFIVSTGRCGSTLLSSILNENHNLLSLSEFFVSLHPDAFQDRELDGKEFWDMIGRPNPLVTLMNQNNLGAPEILNSSKEPIPPMQLITLPQLTKDVDLVFQKMKEDIIRMNQTNLSTQYLNLFAWMCRYFKRKIWVERSGMSLQYINTLVELFPDAKFIHLFRDGMECAMSMSRHHVFRLMLIQMMAQERIGIDPYANHIQEERLAKLDQFANLIPQQFDIQAYLDYHIPIEQFGKMWSNLIMSGVKNLNRIPSDHLLIVRYEDLLENPRGEIKRVMTFIDDDFDDHSVVEKAVTLVRTDKPLSWIHLNEDEKNRLSNECAIGMRLLRNYSKQK